MGIAVGVVVATDLAFAQIYKQFSYQCRPDIDWSVPLRIPSSIYHHDLAKNYRLDYAWGKRRYPIQTNSLGFRDAAPRIVSPLPKSQRILFIGDSFTEGMGVVFENTFIGIISNRLNSRKIEILNAGVVSYSPAIYYRKVKYLLEEADIWFDHLVVFLDISDIPDEAIVYRIDDNDRVIGSTKWVDERKKKKKISLTKILRNNSILFCSGYLIKKTLKTEFSGASDEKLKNRELATGDWRSLWTVDDRMFAKFGAEGLRRASENMDRLLDVVRKYGIDLTVVVYPWPDQIINRDLNSRQVSFWQAWANIRNVQFVNLFPAFISGKDGEATIREYFIPSDMHWNESGHRLVAESFLRHYVQREHQGN